MASPSFGGAITLLKSTIATLSSAVNADIGEANAQKTTINSPIRNKFKLLLENPILHPAFPLIITGKYENISLMRYKSHYQPDMIEYS
jgi:hypothetical protein